MDFITSKFQKKTDTLFLDDIEAVDFESFDELEYNKGFRTIKSFDEKRKRRLLLYWNSTNYNK